eukprot:37984-Eustigmatos_ZCMA.PRE.1
MYHDTRVYLLQMVAYDSGSNDHKCTHICTHSTTHEQIAGRATVEASLAMDTDGQDGNGHGTHCAGLAAGAAAV